MSNLLSLTSAQLIKAANIKDRIDALTQELNALLGGSAAVKPTKKKTGMSAEGRARIAIAQKARWAKNRAAKAKTAPKAAQPAKKKFAMSAAARLKISNVTKARWAKYRAAKAKTAPKAAKAAKKA